MENKDLPQEMKEKEHNQMLLEKIKKIEDEIKLEKGTDNLSIKCYEKCEITLGGKTIQVTIAEIEKSEPEKKEDRENDELEGKDGEEKGISKSYNIYMKDVKIAEIDESGKLILNEEGIQEIDPQDILGLMELGEDEKPDISQINEIEGISSKDLIESLDEHDLEEYEPDFLQNMDEGDLEELEVEISEEEMPEEEELDYLMEIEAAKQGKSKDELKSNMIELELDEIKVTENKTLRQLIGTDCTRVFAVPGRDASEYTLKGLNKEGKLEDLDNLKRVEGTNPNQKIANIDKEGKEVETKSTIAMFELEGKGMQEGIAISQGQFDYKEVSYYRRTEDNEYISTPIAQKGGVDRDESSLETKEMMDRNTTTQDELSAHLDAYEELEELKEQEVPDEIDITRDGIQDKDIRMGKEEMIERLVNHPDYNYTKEEATEIVNNIIDNNMNFDEVREEIDNQKEKEKAEVEEEECERTPWGDAEERRNRGY